MAKKPTTSSLYIGWRAEDRTPITNEMAKGFCTRVQRAYSKQMGKDVAQEFAFHLSDWVVQLRDLWELFASPEPASRKKDLDRVLYSVLIHAPHHLNAAAFILMGDPVTDCFGLGAVKGSGKGIRKPGARYPEQLNRKGRSRKAAVNSKKTSKN